MTTKMLLDKALAYTRMAFDWRYTQVQRNDFTRLALALTQQIEGN